MKVYNINEQDLNQFISLSENNDDFRETVNSLLGGELSFPEWCYVIEREGEIIGRVGFWAPHGNDKKTIRKSSEVKDLSIRTWTCECGAKHDRDINASKNLLKQGKLELGIN